MSISPEVECTKGNLRKAEGSFLQQTAYLRELLFCVERNVGRLKKLTTGNISENREMEKKKFSFFFCRKK